MDQSFRFPSRFTLPASIAIACSDETTTITAAANKVVFRMPYAMRLDKVIATATTAPTISILVIDVHKNGTTIFATKLTVAVSSKTSEGPLRSHVISDNWLPEGAEIAVDFDSVGTAGAGIKLYLNGFREA